MPELGAISRANRERREAIDREVTALLATKVVPAMYEVHYFNALVCERLGQVNNDPYMSSLTPFDQLPDRAPVSSNTTSTTP